MVFLKPFGSLTERTNHYKSTMKYCGNEIMREMAIYLDSLTFRLFIEDGSPQEGVPVCDAACDCLYKIGTELSGNEFGNVIDRARKLHHHYLCLANMNQNAYHQDTQKHESEKFFGVAMEEENKAYLEMKTIDPIGHVEKNPIINCLGEGRYGEYHT